MERYRTLRAYSAGGVVFRLAPIHSSEEQLLIRRHDQEHEVLNVRPFVPGMATASTMEVALVGRSHSGLWVLPKGTPQPGETIEQVAVREVQEETGLLVQLIGYIGSVSYSFIRDHIRY
ncbi:MAG TPA: NUDIX domain-containing protein, partial [Ktedonobacteraceae bacterium]